MESSAPAPTMVSAAQAPHPAPRQSSPKASPGSTAQPAQRSQTPVSVPVKITLPVTQTSKEARDIATAAMSGQSSRSSKPDKSDKHKKSKRAQPYMLSSDLSNQKMKKMKCHTEPMILSVPVLPQPGSLPPEKLFQTLERDSGCAPFSSDRFNPTMVTGSPMVSDHSSRNCEH